MCVQFELTTRTICANNKRNIPPKMLGNKMWLKKYRKNILNATGNGNMGTLIFDNKSKSTKMRHSYENVRPKPMPNSSSYESEHSLSSGNQTYKGISVLLDLHRNLECDYIGMNSITPDFISMPQLKMYSNFLSPELQSNDYLYDEINVQESKEANAMLLEAIWNNNLSCMQSALLKGANPNATCLQNNVSACHIAALKDDKILSFLLTQNLVRPRVDDLGRTPLHFAAWAGNIKNITLLLNTAEETETPAEVASLEQVNSESMDEIHSADVSVKKIPGDWYDDEKHRCPNNELPPIQKGWTPLHAASSNLQLGAIRYLLESGANPEECDDAGGTALDVIASSCNENNFSVDLFSEVIKALVQAKGTFNESKKTRNKFNSPLHTAVRLMNLEILKILLANGAPLDCVDDSGDTIFHVCVENKLKSHLKMLVDPNYTNSAVISEIINKVNNKNENVLQVTLKTKWLPGIYFALKNGADVLSKTNDGDTLMHVAAEFGDISLLETILTETKNSSSLNYENDKGETAFCRAVRHGHMECVKFLLRSGANPVISVLGNLSAVHIACKYGHADILDFLINTKQFSDLINCRTAEMHEGFAPIHFAASYNHPDCVKCLIEAGANFRLKSRQEPYDECTALHEAVVKNNVEVVKILVQADIKCVEDSDDFGWTPLHTASFFGSRESIAILLLNGSDITAITSGPGDFKITAIELLMNNLSKPIDFLEDVFDSCISSNDLNFEAPNCLITIDYRIFAHDTSFGQSKAIKALLGTGNRFDQRKLLVHPLLESFVFLKWLRLLPLFYIITTIYSVFVLSLNVYIVTAFTYQDMEKDKPFYYLEDLCKYIIYLTGSVLAILELLSFKCKLSYLCQFEVPINIITIGLALSVPSFVGGSTITLDLPRNIATITLILSWLQILLIMSKFPQWGYYVQMFGKVSTIVIKVLLTFSFVVIGFSLSFMIQFHSQIPFDGPWSAFVKTMVMMMSEFDYENMFKEQQTQTNMEFNRIMFIVFLVFAGIVLMNLLIGLAVNDLNFLQVQGNMRRIEKQVHFLASVDAILGNPIIEKVLKKDCYIDRCNLSGLMIKPDDPNWGMFKSLPQNLRDAIFEKIQTKSLKKNFVDKVFKSKLDEIYEVHAHNYAKVNEEIERMAAKMKLFEDILIRIENKLQ